MSTRAVPKAGGLVSAGTKGWVEKATGASADDAWGQVGPAGPTDKEAND